MRFFTRKKEPVNEPAPKNPAKNQDAGIGLSFGRLFSSKPEMMLSAVYRSVNIISDSVAQLPAKTYIERETTAVENGTEVKRKYLQEYRESPVYSLLYRFPNGNMSRFTLLKSMVCDMLLHGNAYAFIERDRRTLNPVAIHYIPAGSVSLQYDTVNPINPDVQYITTGFAANIRPEDMIHILNYTTDGIAGISTIRYAALATGLSMSSETHAQNFFESGANLAGLLNVNSALDDKQRQQLLDSWKKAFRMDSNGVSTGIAVLQGNMTYQPLTVNPTDAQLLETRKFNITDIARFFGVSPTKLFDFTNSSYSTVEATQLAFLTDTLAPILQKFELEFERKLFSPEERNAIDVRFDTSGLVRLDVTAQSNYYKSLYNMGAVTPNEIRRETLRPPVPDGDNVFIQGAMTTMSNAVKGINYKSPQNNPQNNPQPEGKPDNNQLQQ